MRSPMQRKPSPQDAVRGWRWMRFGPRVECMSRSWKGGKMRSQTPDIVYAEGRSEALVELERIQAMLSTAKANLELIDARSSIKCCSCSATHLIATQEYIQTHWYTSSHGCTGGDYWNTGEGNWRCPSCGFLNRFDAEKDKYATIPNSFYRPEIVSLKNKFGRVKDTC